MLEEKVNSRQINQVDPENEPPFKRYPDFKDVFYRITLFLIGLFGLDVIGIIVQLVIKWVKPEMLDETSALFSTGLMLVNTIRYTVITIVFVALLWPRLKIIAKKFANWKNDLIGLGAGILLILATIAYNLIISEFTDVTTNVNEEAAESMILSYPIFSVIVLGFLGPIVEEITYRYGLFSAIDKKNKILAYIATIIIFAFIHFDFTDNIKNELLNLPSYIIAGAILTITYDRLGFNASIIAHVTNNLYAIVVTLIYYS